MSSLSLLPLAVIALFLTGNANATVIASDSFASAAGGDDYNVGNVYDQSPTVGLTGFAGGDAWTNTEAASTADLQIRSASYTHGLVVGSQLSGSIGTNNGVADRGVFRPFESFTPVTGTYYFSFVINSIAGLEHNAMGITNNAPRRNAASADVEGVQVGVNGSAMNLYIDGGDSITQLMPTFTADESYFVLVQIDNVDGGTDTVTASVWAAANTDLNSPTATSGAVSGVEISDNLTHFGVTKGNHSGNGTNFDEFRFATTLQEVAVPEAYTSALFLIGASAGLVRRRRE